MASGCFENVRQQIKKDNAKQCADCVAYEQGNQSGLDAPRHQCREERRQRATYKAGRDDINKGHVHLVVATANQRLSVMRRRKAITTNRCMLATTIYATQLQYCSMPLVAHQTTQQTQSVRQRVIQARSSRPCVRFCHRADMKKIGRHHSPCKIGLQIFRSHRHAANVAEQVRRYPRSTSGCRLQLV